MKKLHTLRIYDQWGNWFDFKYKKLGWLNRRAEQAIRYRWFVKIL